MTHTGIIIKTLKETIKITTIFATLLLTYQTLNNIKNIINFIKILRIYHKYTYTHFVPRVFVVWGFTIIEYTNMVKQITIEVIEALDNADDICIDMYKAHNHSLTHKKQQTKTQKLLTLIYNIYTYITHILLKKLRQNE